MILHFEKRFPLCRSRLQFDESDVMANILKYHNVSLMGFFRLHLFVSVVVLLTVYTHLKFTIQPLQGLQ